MYTVLLVDDDADILHSLLHIIDWPVYGIETVLTAYNGVDALQKLTEQPVNLLITDISMPGMDGITLFKQVRTTYPHIRCIFLSSYSDFAYAREAITLGVENYLLKPVKTEELDDSIRKALDNISMHRHVMKTLFLDNVLYRWVTNDISHSELAERSKHIDVNIYFNNYCIVLVKMCHRSSSNELLSPFLLQLKRNYDIYNFLDNNGQNVIIIGGQNISQETLHHCLLSTLKQTRYHHDFFAAIGTVVVGSNQVAMSYQSAKDCLLLCRTLTGQHITLAESLTYPDVSDYQLGQLSNLLKESLEADSVINAQPIFQELFADIHYYPLSEINSFLNMLAIKLFRFLISQGLIDPCVEESININFYHFEEFPTEAILYKSFCELLNMNLILMKQNLNRLSPICLLAMQYVADNFTEYVSIKDFCSRYNSNPSYFGFLFKKETGIYFNDYISQIRINHAMMLLKDPAYKITQISQMTGFGNTSYFIQWFKKQTGMSPANFRHMLTNAEHK